MLQHSKTPFQCTRAAACFESIDGIDNGSKAILEGPSLWLSVLSQQPPPCSKEDDNGTCRSNGRTSTRDERNGGKFRRRGLVTTLQHPSRSTKACVDKAAAILHQIPEPPKVSTLRRTCSVCLQPQHKTNPISSHSLSSHKHASGLALSKTRRSHLSHGHEFKKNA